MKSAVVKMAMITLVLTAAAGAASAHERSGYIRSSGGGGIFESYQIATSPGFDSFSIPGSNLGLSLFGGFGYRIDSRNQIAGGFGYGIIDHDKSRGIAGGMGGFINGYRFFKWPVNFSLISWTGFGGIYTGNSPKNPNQGYLCVSEELDLEFGLPVCDWFMPSVFVGYHVMGNLAPGRTFEDFIAYSPVVGFRIAWGHFR